MVSRPSDNAIEARVLRVFVDREDQFGNPLGVIFDPGDLLSPRVRQDAAIALGYSETVFVTDVRQRRIAIHSPQSEVEFSGHAVVGAAWLLRLLLGEDVGALEGSTHSFRTWSADDGVVWVAAPLRCTAPWSLQYMPSATTVDRLTVPPEASRDHTQVWSWLDKDLSTIRARTFASRFGIPEDEANGSGCMRLAAVLGQPIEVLHGEGSVVYASPQRPGWAAVGGRVVEDERRVVTHPSWTASSGRFLGSD
jgi:predicted PhzF superfamily epimerase YddE/YHI9